MKNVKSIVAMTLLCCIKSSNLPHFEILGAPIGDYLYCANFISSKRQQAARLLSRLEGVARIDPQVALLLLRICAGFCKLVHLARTTPPRLASESLLLFDDDVRVWVPVYVRTGSIVDYWAGAGAAPPFGGRWPDH